MAYLKQMDTARGGRCTDIELAQMMLESYNTYFRKPMLDAGLNPPELTERELTVHFTQHDINPLRQLRKDLNRINLIQDTLEPRQATSGGGITCNEPQAKRWLEFHKSKMELVKQLEMCNRHTCRDMPTLGTD